MICAPLPEATAAGPGGRDWQAHGRPEIPNGAASPSAAPDGRTSSRSHPRPRDTTREATGGSLARLDRAAMTALQARPRRAGLVTAARVVSTLAEPACTSALLATGVLRTGRRAGWRPACMMCLTVATGAGFRRMLSRAISRPRPPAAGWLVEPEGFSLPSRHTTLAGLAVGACVQSTGVPGPVRCLPPFLAATVVGASRVYLGVHWPTDILAAWLFTEGWLRLADISQPATWRPSRS